MKKFSKLHIKIIFLSQSKRQTKQYQLLCKKTDMEGTVINIKRPGILGRFVKTGRWLVKNRACIPNWIELQQEKSKVRGGGAGFLYKWLLVLRIYRVLSKFIFEFERAKANVLFVRNGAGYRQTPVIDWCKQQGVSIAYIENGFLPSTIQLDGRGVNCNNSIPRNSSFYMDFISENKNSPDKTLVQRQPKVIQSEFDGVELPEQYYFVPFQVPTDTQVLLNSPWIRSMEEFYEVLEKSVEFLPDSFKFVIKEHPSSNVRLDDYYNRNELIVFANSHNTQNLIENSKAVITLNSTVGIESLLLGKPVITLGDACYNIDGLTYHADRLEALGSIISAPDKINYNKVLADKFIAWLDQVYLIPGKLRDFEKSDSSCFKVKERVEEIYKGAETVTKSV